MNGFEVGHINSILKVLYKLPQDAEVVAEVGDFGPVVSYEIVNCFRFNDWGDNELGLYPKEPKNGIFSVSQVISEIEKTSASKLIIADSFPVEHIIQIDNKDELRRFLHLHLPTIAQAESEFSEIIEKVKFPFVIFDV